MRGEEPVFLEHMFSHGSMTPGLVGTQVAGDALTAVEELHGVGGVPDIVMQSRQWRKTCGVIALPAIDGTRAAHRATIP